MTEADDIYTRLQRAAHPHTPLPAKYAKWRDNLFPRGVDLLDGLNTLSDVMLQEAWRTLLPGLTAEKLDPRSPELDGSFHLAAGMVMGIMHTRGLNIPVKTWPLG